ncbi:MAG: hypothetical protein M3285_09795 [Actinomycetota bacterium]|nr:hypothetical protein [Actinomycetota bacterium]
MADRSRAFLAIHGELLVIGETWLSQKKSGGRCGEAIYGDHPVSIWVREESLLEGVLGFFSERVFGPNRRDLLEADLRRSEASEDKEALQHLKSLEKTIGQFERRQARLIRSLELDDDPQGAMFRQIRDRMQQLEDERRQKLEELEALRREQPDAVPGSPGLLDELPVTEDQLVPAPEIVLRDLFEAFRVEVRYNKVSSWATCRVAINEEGMEGLVAHSTELLKSGATWGFARGARDCGRFRSCSVSLVALSSSSPTNLGPVLTSLPR